MFYVAFLALILLSTTILDRVNKNFFTFFIASILFQLIYSFIPALQNGIGTDYYSYVEIYDTGKDLQRFYEANEFLYYFAFEFFREMSLGAQAIFVFSAVINAFLTVLILFRLKALSFNLTIFAFVFFCVSGIYHNQMNGLRQFTAVLSVILCSLYLHSSSFKTILSAFLALLSHTSSLLVLPTLLVSKLNITKRKLIFIFLFSFPLYFFLLPLFFEHLISLIGGGYIKYVEFERDVGLLASLTKLYYIPFFIFFIRFFDKNPTILNRISVISFCTYPMFFAMQDIAIISRIYYYYYPFIIFIVYGVLIRFKNDGMKMEYYCSVLYLLIPYVLKVTAFSTAEYSFNIKSLF